VIKTIRKYAMIVLFILFIMSTVLMMSGMNTLASNGDSIVATYNLGPEGDETAVIGTLYSDRRLVIKGSGPMGDYSRGESPINGHNDKIKDITINPGVETIGRHAFFLCDDLKYLSIPETVKTIGEGAFYNCNKLMTVEFGGTSTLTSIGTRAFAECTDLKEITIPESVTNIGEGAFQGCRKLRQINIPDGITVIKPYTFSGCSKLESVTLPDSLHYIGTSAFESCDTFEKIIIPENVTAIDSKAFSNCKKLSRAIFKGNAPTNFGTEVFAYCDGDFKVGYIFGNESFESSIVDGKWNGYDIFPLFTVTYNANSAESGSVPVDKDLYEAGDTVRIQGNTGSLKKEGFEFLGWNTLPDGSGTTYREGNKLIVDGTGHIMLYAKWESPAIISVYISWGSMEFTYTDASKGTWDPETHQYKGATEATWSCENDANKITVTNHSNAGIKAVLGYTSGEGFSEINGNFSKDSYTLRSAEGTTRGNAPSYDFYLTLSGSLNESALENTVIGTVTITIYGLTD